LRLGTRGSALALAQATAVRDRLATLHGFSPGQIRIETIRTSGDMIRDRPLAQAGGKGLFTKEIEEALLAGRIDLAVHSAKDMPTLLPAGLAIGAVLPREDARDAFISSKAQSLRDLPQGSTMALHVAPAGTAVKPADLAVVTLRGNVDTLAPRTRVQSTRHRWRLPGSSAWGCKARRRDKHRRFSYPRSGGIIAVEARSDDARVMYLTGSTMPHRQRTCGRCAHPAVLGGSQAAPHRRHVAIHAGRLHFGG
jgi:hydroxymethylbilane synthase